MWGIRCPQTTARFLLCKDCRTVGAFGVFLRLCRDLSMTDFETASTIAEDIRTGGVVGGRFEATVHFIVKLCNNFSFFSVLLRFH